MPPGFKRSRALWDEARRPGAPTMALVRAVGYELQPIRFSSVDTSAVKAWGHQYAASVKGFITETLPTATQSTIKVLRGMSKTNWLVVGGVLFYCYAIRLIHEALDAGPLVLIISALVAIFTIGLGNNENKDGISAYSVFNRGFQSIMGSVDVEALVQQHVGGAMGAGAMGMAGGGRVDDDMDDFDEQPPARRARRPVPEQRHVHDNNNGDDGNGNGNDDGHDEGPRLQARKSGKKARRGNLEQRREHQRQRQAAIAMGFGGDGGHDEQLAMQMILEEQIAANAARENHD